MHRAKKFVLVFKKKSNLTSQRSQKFTSQTYQEFDLLSASLFSVSLKQTERKHKNITTDKVYNFAICKITRNLRDTKFSQFWLKYSLTHANIRCYVYEEWHNSQSLNNDSPVRDSDRQGLRALGLGRADLTVMVVPSPCKILWISKTEAIQSGHQTATESEIWPALPQAAGFWHY